MPIALIVSYIIAIILGLLALIDLVRLGVLSISVPLAIGIIIGLPTLICLWVIFKREGMQGWAAIVPIYNGVYVKSQGITSGLSGSSLSRLLISFLSFLSVRVWPSISSGAHVLVYTCSGFSPSFFPYWLLAREYNMSMTLKQALPSRMSSLRLESMLKERRRHLQCSKHQQQRRFRLCHRR